MSEQTSPEARGEMDNGDGALSRRRMLLAGTALAASSLSGGAAVAQAQPTPLPQHRRWHRSTCRAAVCRLETSSDVDRVAVSRVLEEAAAPEIADNRRSGTLHGQAPQPLPRRASMAVRS